MNKKSIIFNFFCFSLFCPLLWTNIVSAQSITASLPLGKGRVYSCLKFSDNNSNVSRFSSRGHILVNGENIQRRTSRAIRRTRQKLEATNDPILADRLNKKLDIKRKLFRDLRNCNSGQIFQEMDNVCRTVSNQIEFRVINGEACNSLSSPIVKIQLLGGNGGFVSSCSATIVSQQAIVTAAHCVDGISSVRVIAGNNPVSSNIIIHPDYNIQTGAHDLAIVKFKSNLGRRPAFLTASNRYNSGASGETIMIGGFGLDEDNRAGRFKAGFAFLSGVRADYLITRFRFDDALDDSTSCFGDSGGPLLVRRNRKWTLAGVVSSGTSASCGVNGGLDVGFYTKITNNSNASFIRNNISNLNFL